MAPLKEPTQVDVIQNKLNMLFASQERLLQTWLPPPTAEELSQQKSAEEIEKEEEAIFRPMPTNLGVGAPLPKDLFEADGSAVRKLTADDRLRKKLLGGRAALFSQAKTKQATSKEAEREQKPSRSRQHDNGVDDDEEEAGRSALGRSKRSKSKGQGHDLQGRSEKAKVAADAVSARSNENRAEEEEEGDPPISDDTTSPAAKEEDEKKSSHVDTTAASTLIRPKKRASTFLDVMLAEKRSRGKGRKG